ncbi:MAG: response regulator [Pseudoxanthomonas sp.]
MNTLQAQERGTSDDIVAGKRVLLVEDEALITTLIVDLMEDRGVVVIGPAATLAHAIELARTEVLDAAILDVNLGSETSFPVAGILRDRGVPFFYTTAFANKTHPDVAGEAFLPKPYGIKQLFQTLEEVLARTYG